MYRKKTGSALIIALVVMTLLTMITTVFFEKVQRFSQRSEGIENSNVAYYKALGIIESALFDPSVTKNSPWNIQNNTIGGGYLSSGATIQVSTGGTSVPLPGKGNSQYDVSRNYNIISLGNPVQLVIPNGITWNNVNFEFRVPIIGGNTSTGVDFVSSNSGIILWTLASTGASLFSSGSEHTFRGNEITVASPITISNKEGRSNSGSFLTFGNFYSSLLGTNGANCVNFKCTLKLSMIAPVTTTDGRSMSFLEYRITGLDAPIPAQFMNIEAQGYAYGFLRTRSVQFPQITTNTVLDFTVLQ